LVRDPQPNGYPLKFDPASIACATPVVTAVAVPDLLLVCGVAIKECADADDLDIGGSDASGKQLTDGRKLKVHVPADRFSF